MNILCLTEDFYPNLDGGALVQWRFCRLAAADGHEVTVVTAKYPDEPDDAVVDDVRIARPARAKYGRLQGYEYSALLSRFLFSLAVFLRGARLCWNGEFDCVYSPTQSTHWVAAALSTLYRLPHVSFVGGTPSVESDPPLTPKLLLERVNFRFFLGDRVFCRNESVRAILSELGVSVQITHGILDAEKIRDSVEGLTDRRASLLEDSDTLLVSVGRLIPLKNPTGAVDVLAALPENYRLVMIGDGPLLESVRDHAEDVGVADRLTLTGRLEHRRTLETVAAADALVLTSDFEAHPTVAFEGLSLGCDVFATPVGTLPSIDLPRLHVCELDRMAPLVQDTDLESTGLEESVLQRFSVEQYERDVIGAMAELVEATS